jgi:hypothetical protein
MPVTIGFRPFATPQNGPVKSISKGTYATNPSWHTPQDSLQMKAFVAQRNVPGDDFVSSDILSAARTLKSLTSATMPTSGGTLSINNQFVGSYDYVVKPTTTIPSSWSPSDWFTSTQDTRSAWILVNGNLTIELAANIIPPVRKLFTVIYVSGNMTLTGSISMTSRGANHSGIGTSGGYVAPVNIRLGTGTFNAISNPFIPATGGAGAASRSTAGQTTGTAGTDGATGGGGGGVWFNAGGTVGAGSAGTCFSGGSGSGAVYNSVPSSVSSADAGINGGAGSAGAGNLIAAGGSGNPGGLGYTDGNPTPSLNGGTGTAGTLIIICEGTLSGSGGIESAGIATGLSGGLRGGSSGGGSVTIFYKTDTSNFTTFVTGGNSGGGGAGGAGTLRRFAIGAN